MVKTVFECKGCKYKIEIKTPIGEAPFMMVYHELKEFIARRIIRIHCKLNKHFYECYETFD